MKPLSLIVLFLVVAAPVFGEAVEIEIPKEGWRVRFDSPQLSDRQESHKSGGYAVRGSSARFNLSLFVEEPGAVGKTHQDCYSFYWPQASRNPLIEKESVSRSETEKYVRVQYDLVGQFEGKSFRSRNVNYYFAFRGKWVDLHISVIEPTASDDALFKAFDTSLDYGQ